jgi:acyl-CoA dehydrogenase
VNEEANLIDTSARLFEDFVQDRAAGFEQLWPEVRTMGFPLLLVPEKTGGIGARISDAFGIVKAAGYHAVPLPLPECLIGHAAHTRAGIAADTGLTTIAWRSEGAVVGDKFTGCLRSVPWGRHADRVVVYHAGQNLILCTAEASSIVRAQNPAGEPRDTLDFTDAPVQIASGPSVFRLGALLRTAQIAGALQASLEISVSYANERVQFGRSIGKFQAIQHNLAMFAAEAAAATAAGEAAARAADLDDAAFEIAAAKCRANKAAALGHATAHAVHGAIGFTMEHPLNHLTRRLLGWRSEFGGENHWSAWLGRSALEMARGGFWEALTARSDDLGLRLRRTD